MQEAVKLDEFDLKLVAAILRDGALSNQGLSERVGLSASQCSRRHMRLIDLGVIKGYRAVVDAEMLGFAILVFVRVTLAAHGPKNTRKFRDLVEETDEIQEAHMLAGDADYLLKVIVKDLAALSDLVNGVLLAHDSVARVRSDIVLDSLKEEGRLPIHPEEART